MRLSTIIRAYRSRRDLMEVARHEACKTKVWANQKRAEEVRRGWNKTYRYHERSSIRLLEHILKRVERVERKESNPELQFVPKLLINCLISDLRFAAQQLTGLDGYMTLDELVDALEGGDYDHVADTLKEAKPYFTGGN